VKQWSWQCRIMAELVAVELLDDLVMIWTVGVSWLVENTLQSRGPP